MNELIKELSDKAWDYTDKNAKHDDHGLVYRDKFAQLLIKECANYVDEIESENFPSQIITIGRCLVEHFELGTAEST